MREPALGISEQGIPTSFFVSFKRLIPTQTDMSRFCLRNRNELAVIDPSHVAYVRADSNYIHIKLISQQELYFNCSIADIINLLNIHADSQNRFIKIGRSLIVNLRLITRVLPQKNQLILADPCGWSTQLNLPHKTLIRLCAQLDDFFSSDNETASSEKHTTPSNHEK